MMDRRLDWIVSNGVLAAGLYFAVVAQAPWVQYAIAAFTWAQRLLHQVAEGLAYAA